MLWVGEMLKDYETAWHSLIFQTIILKRYCTQNDKLPASKLVASEDANNVS